MSDLRLRIIAAAAALLTVLGASATSIRSKALIDSLNIELSKVHTPADSLPILYNIYDLSVKKAAPAVGEKIYHVARRLGDIDAQIDILRQLANVYVGNDSMQLIMQHRAEQLPVSDAQKDALTYIRVSRVSTSARAADQVKREEILHDLLKKYTSHKNLDQYEEIELLFMICIYISQTTQGDLLTTYMQKLADCIDKLPFKSGGLRNMFYTQAAIIYSQSGSPAEAVESDRRLIAIIENLQSRYQSQGRIYRNYDRNFYTIYRRMLSNSAALTPEEIEYYYKKVNEIVNRHSELKKDNDENRRAEIYYLMANKRYNEAKTLLLAHLDNPLNKGHRRNLLRMLKKAALATGDNDALLKASLGYNDELERYISQKSTEQYSELQIIYDINDLRSQRTNMQLEKRESELRSHRIIILVSALALISLIVLATVLFRSYRHSKKLTDGIAKANKLLVSERDNLKKTQIQLIKARDNAHDADRQKTEFINNMSHEVKEPVTAIVNFSHLIVDSIDDNKRKYLDRYIKVVEFNADLLQTIVNDVLEVAEMEHNEMKTNYRDVSIKSLCNIAAESVMSRLHPSVRLEVKNPADGGNLHIQTDPERVHQVLVNLLGNAAKFTEEGSITLEYGINADRTRATFTVSDTGPGIPQGKEDIVFNRFEKLNSSKPGSGLGLHVCRLIAELLGGEVYVDTKYKDGARFVFTIPVTSPEEA